MVDNYGYGADIDSDKNTYEYSEIADECRPGRYSHLHERPKQGSSYDDDSTNRDNICHDKSFGGQNVLRSLSNVTRLELLANVDARALLPALNANDDGGTADAEAGQPESAEDFIGAFKKPLEQPLITSTPKLRQTRRRAPRDRTNEQLVPKRSARLAKKSKHREPKPDAQARKVMMKRLGVHVETEHPDEASFDEFQTAFKLPLSDTTREAMQELLPARKQRTRRSVRA